MVAGSAALWARSFVYMLVVGSVHFVALPRLLLMLEANAPPVSSREGLVPAFGIVVIVLGAALALFSARHLVVYGHGTPFPLDRTRVLVRSGPYRFIRNPQAVAAVLIVFGECLLVESRLIWLLLPATLLYLELVARPIEDRQLRRDFGDEYVAYRERVRRWLPPMTTPTRNGPATMDR